MRDWLIARAARDFTLRGLVAELSAEFGVKVDYVEVWRFVHEERLSFKKGVLPGEQLRPKIAHHRERRRKYQKRIDPPRLIFVDETLAKTNMAPLRGWAQVGQRLHAKVPYGHWKTMTFRRGGDCSVFLGRAVVDCVPAHADQRAELGEWLIGCRPGDDRCHKTAEHSRLVQCRLSLYSGLLWGGRKSVCNASRISGSAGMP